MSGPKYKYNNYDKKKKNQEMDNNHFLYILGGNWCNVNNIDCQNLRICIKILGVNYNVKSTTRQHYGFNYRNLNKKNLPI